MQLDNEGFYWKDLMDFTHQCFEAHFGEKIQLIEARHSQNACGYYTLKYEYFPKEYTLFFEHENLYFSIEITRSDDAFTSIGLIYPGEIKGELKAENISYAIQKLYDAFKKDNIVFYKIKKNKRVIAGDILRCDCAQRQDVTINSWKVFEELKDFFKQQVELGIFDDVKVERPYYIGTDNHKWYADKWYQCNACSTLWEFSYPEFPQKGWVRKIL